MPAWMARMRQGRAMARAAGPPHRRPRLRHDLRRRGKASAASTTRKARARPVTAVGQSAQPPADRVMQRLRPQRRWTAPAHGWAARPRSGPLSARQRAQMDAAPCLTNSPPYGLQKEGTGAAALCPCHGFLPPRHPLEGALRIADRSWRSAAVPLLPLCGLSSLLVILRNVMPQGSCVKASPRCTHQQDGHRVLATSEGGMACQARLGASGPRSHA